MCARSNPLSVVNTITIIVSLLVALASAFFVVPHDPNSPLFLRPGNNTWIENHGPLRSEPHMTILLYRSPHPGNIITDKHTTAVSTDIGSCSLTEDQSLISSADMVWFHWPNMRAAPRIPRPHGALWVYYNLESPGYSHNRQDALLKTMDPSINMLASYQLESDIYETSYGAIIHRVNKTASPAIPAWATKSRLAVNMISATSVSPVRERRIKVSWLCGVVWCGVVWCGVVTA